MTPEVYQNRRYKHTRNRDNNTEKKLFAPFGRSKCEGLRSAMPLDGSHVVGDSDGVQKRFAPNK